MVCRLERPWAVCSYVVPRLLAQRHLKESELINVIEKRARLIGCYCAALSPSELDNHVSDSTPLRVIMARKS